MITVVLWFTKPQSKWQEGSTMEKLLTFGQQGSWCTNLLQGSTLSGSVEKISKHINKKHLTLRSWDMGKSSLLWARISSRSSATRNHLFVIRLSKLFNIPGSQENLTMKSQETTWSSKNTSTKSTVNFESLWTWCISYPWSRTVITSKWNTSNKSYCSWSKSRVTTSIK